MRTQAMTKLELVQQIAKKYPNLGITDIKKLIDTIFLELSTALANQDRIEIRGFGSMSVRSRKPRVVRNPKTNERVSIGERNVVYFRIGKECYNKLNPVNSNN